MGEPGVAAGAQLAGTSQHKLASHMIDLLSGRLGPGATSGRLRGVVFYATLGAGLPSSIGQEGWYVMDMQKRIASKNRSPLCEADAFVLFDEARCR